MDERYRVCVIGCGRMGARIDKDCNELDDNVMSYRPVPIESVFLPYSHVATYRALDNTEVVAVSDISAEKVEIARRCYDVPGGYTDYREMLEKEQPDIISIATRPATHAEMTVFAAEHGVKGIYCEKPLCCSMEEADAMVEACEKHGVKFNFNTQRRYDPRFRKIREMIRNGELGNVYCVIGNCGVNSPAQWDQIHTADMLVFLSGDSEIDYVQGTVNLDEADFARNRIETDPGIAMGFVMFKNGVHGYIVSNSGYEYEIAGTKGKIRTLNNGSSCQFRKTVKWSRFEETSFPDIPIESSMVNGVKDILDAIKTERQTEGNIQLARRSQEMIIGFIESHRQGGARVTLPLENRNLYIGRADW